MKIIHRFSKIISVLILSFSTSASAEGLSIDPIKIINKISNRLFEIGVSTARSFAEISYEDVRYDPNLETFFVSGLKIIPFSLEALDGCEIDMGALNISGTRNENLSSEQFSIGVSDLEINQFCFPLETRAMLSLSGISNINIPFLKIDIGHEYKSAATTFALYGELQDSVSFTMGADLGYFSVATNSDLTFVAKLQALHVRFENNGLWENISKQLPKQFVQSGIAGTGVSLFLAQELKNILNQNLVDKISGQVAQAVDDFIEEPKSITISTQISSADGVNLDYEIFQNPNLTYIRLNPVISVNNAKQSKHVSKSDLDKILNGNLSGFETKKLFELGISFNSGIGTIKNSNLSRKIFEYLASNGHEKANEMLIDLYLSEGSFSDAYIVAQKMGSQGNKNAPTYLNTIEKQLSLSEIIQLQQETTNFKETKNKDEPQFYSLARGYLTGNSSPKSYESAYFWALIAKSNGDVRANYIIEKVEALKNKLPEIEANIWSNRLKEVQDEAGGYWMKRIN